MRNVKHVLLAGGAALALAGTGIGTATIAHAQTGPTHVLDVALPDGSMAQIRYVGDVPPQVSFAPVAMPAAAAADPFPAFDRAFDGLAAQMDLQAAAMLRAAQMMTAPVLLAAPMQVGFANLPPGVQGYSTITTFNGNSVCTRSTTYTAQAAGGAPRMVTHVSGNCGDDALPSPRATLPAVQPRTPYAMPRTIEAKAVPANRWPAYKSMVRQVAELQR